MKKLYYVVENECYDTVPELTGNSTLTVYQIEENQPKIFCEVQCFSWNSFEGPIPGKQVHKKILPTIPFLSFEKFEFVRYKLLALPRFPMPR